MPLRPVSAAADEFHALLNPNKKREREEKEKQSYLHQ